MVYENTPNIGRLEACSLQLTAMPSRRAYREQPAKRETSLYVPVKRFLERLGFDVKGEICGCDVVALRGDEPPLVVVGELKLAFNLELLLQGIDRTPASAEVSPALPMSPHPAPHPAPPLPPLS